MISFLKDFDNLFSFVFPLINKQTIDDSYYISRNSFSDFLLNLGLYLFYNLFYFFKENKELLFSNNEITIKLFSLEKKIFDNLGLYEDFNDLRNSFDNNITSPVSNDDYYEHFYD